jgi:hypothetical protein
MLDQHALNATSQRARTNVPGSTVSGWLRDIPPSIPNALKFVRGLGEDPGEALSILGVEQASEQDTPTYDAVYAREMLRVRERLTAEGIYEVPEELGHKGGTRNLTAADAIAEAKDFEEWVRELYGKATR